MSSNEQDNEYISNYDAEQFPCKSGCLADTVKSTLAQVLECKQIGCPRCSLVLEGVMRFIHGRKSLDSIKDIMIYDNLNEKLIYVTYENNELDRIHMFIQDLSDGGNELQVAPRLPDYTGSEESLEWVISNLNKCLKDHKTCQVGAGGSMPRRLLDLRAINMKLPLENSRIKVIETDGQKLPYFCLSHCWGPMQPLRTLKDTLKSYIDQGISWLAIPKTFQDAVMLTRRFGGDYIWIDSLCIVQDDHKDWQDESKNMCSIYQNAVLTISATKSTDSRGGCFTATPDTYRGFVIEAQGRTKLLQVIVRQFFTYHRRYVAQRPLPVDQDSPLLNRAWAFQERLLSPRVIHFGQIELLWECREQSTCQCNSAPMLRRLPRKVEHQSMLSAGPGLDMKNYWYSIVEDYTMAQLSFESDRLPAIFGLAKEFMGYSGREYIAGVWRDSLATDLLWMVSQPPRKPRVARGSVPSWSWASVANAVDYNDAKQIVAVTTSDGLADTPLSVQRGIVDSKVSGLLQGDVLVTRGALVEVRLVIDSARQKLQAGFDDKGVYRVVGVSSTADMTEEYTTGGRSFHADYPLEADHEEEGRTMKGGHVLYVFMIKSAQNVRYSLVLQHVDAERKIFERVGLLREHLPSDSDVAGSDRLISDEGKKSEDNDSDKANGSGRLSSARSSMDRLSEARPTNLEDSDEWSRSGVGQNNNEEWNETMNEEHEQALDPWESSNELDHQAEYQDGEARERNQTIPEPNEVWGREELYQYVGWDRQGPYERGDLSHEEPDLFAGCQEETEIIIV